MLPTGWLTLNLCSFYFLSFMHETVTSTCASHLPTREHLKLETAFTELKLFLTATRLPICRFTLCLYPNLFACNAHLAVMHVLWLRLSDWVYWWWYYSSYIWTQGSIWWCSFILLCNDNNNNPSSLAFVEYFRGKYTIGCYDKMPSFQFCWLCRMYWLEIEGNVTATS